MISKMFVMAMLSCIIVVSMTSTGNIDLRNLKKYEDCIKGNYTKYPSSFFEYTNAQSEKDKSKNEFLMDFIVNKSTEKLGSFLKSLGFYIFILIIGNIAFASLPWLWLCCCCNWCLFNDNKEQGTCGTVNLILAATTLATIFITALVGLSISANFEPYFDAAMCGLRNFNHIPRFGEVDSMFKTYGHGWAGTQKLLELLKEGGVESDPLPVFPDEESEMYAFNRSSIRILSSEDLTIDELTVIKDNLVLFDSLMSVFVKLIVEALSTVETVLSIIIMTVFHSFFSVFLILISNAIIMLGLYIFCSCYWVRFCLHGNWNMLILFTSASCILGCIFGVIGTLAKQMVPVLEEYYSNDFILSDSSPFPENKQEAAHIFKECLNSRTGNLFNLWNKQTNTANLENLEEIAVPNDSLKTITRTELRDKMNCEYMKDTMIHFLENFSIKLQLVCTQICNCCFTCGFISYISIFFVMSTIYYYSDKAKSNSKDIDTSNYNELPSKQETGM